MTGAAHDQTTALGHKQPAGPVVTLGEVMALMLADDDLPLPVATHFTFGVAGAEATVAVGLSRLGVPAAYIGRLGDDPFGQRVLYELRGEGVDTQALRLTPAAPTGVLVRDSPQDRPVSVVYHRRESAASRLEAADVPEKLVRAASLLHITGITGVLSESAYEATQHAVSLAQAAQVPVSLDPNVRHRLATPERWRTVVDALARRVDVVLTGADEARFLADDPQAPPERWFLERGARTVVVKDGASGAYENDGQAMTTQPAHPAVAVDTVGAGDAFDVGWLAGWLAGLPPERRLRQAAVVAALCVGTRGDLPGLPDRPTLDLLLGGADNTTAQR